MSMWLISDHACAQEVKGKGYVMCCIHAYIIDIHVYTMWLFYHPETWLFYMWSILIDTPMFTSMQQGCTNPAGITAYLQPCDHLVTTLLQPWNWLAGMTNPGLDNLVTTLYQPCHNLAPTLLLPCSQVGARLIQAGHNVVNTWFKDGCTTLWQGCHNLVFSIWVHTVTSDVFYYQTTRLYMMGQ